ncbi:N-acetylmuramoyl-L-alanine amidase [Alkalithermobacter thermoalcaliphilus JW-YL-7 = DSM 7308]|uniref:N-acetylmuramoyl-L-alanine amidase n=1 Tax=Alkalithermobacter thermoalcaliphilus JW-YL-7 = DSM 7308 TaxID=1121328 RepID=A0A150FPE4_CLOPD|nr:N-acetylmuramoyl-L-alanine amidase family 2 [[Clostridium] paradoxum JW-YL-7 = DSM 7308]SHK49799.1 N-acetylmuramoyl-L-alanine amidase [[Clostridium] paradoxum JW-YL-7 = DSM 7308]
MQYITDLIPKSTPNNRRPAIPLISEYITIHSTGNPSSTAKNERAWLTNPTNTRQASYHIVVDEKEAIEVIPTGLKNIFPNTQTAENSWNAGDGRGKGNMASIAIEICESGDREKTLQNAIELVARILMEKKWDTDRIKQHYDWSGKNCPRILRDTGRWNWFIQQVQKKKEEIIKMNMKKDYEGHWAEKQIREIIEKGIMNGYTDGNFYPNAPLTRAEMAVVALNIINYLKK